MNWPPILGLRFSWLPITPSTSYQVDKGVLGHLRPLAPLLPGHGKGPWGRPPAAWQGRVVDRGVPGLGPHLVADEVGEPARGTWREASKGKKGGEDLDGGGLRREEQDVRRAGVVVAHQRVRLLHQLDLLAQ